MRCCRQSTLRKLNVKKTNTLRRRREKNGRTTRSNGGMFALGRSVSKAALGASKSIIADIIAEEVKNNAKRELMGNQKLQKSYSARNIPSYTPHHDENSENIKPPNPNIILNQKELVRNISANNKGPFIKPMR